eukprot:TRINITY_DN688_c0_g2_i1.p1 TRINITY_DN688_c0_g2~~TRINITY_DN688_c0_g2_i1.p1  ORF type:complete len:204 (+),score=30.32 TRINITY_DN688_c0_g2_i1:65-676(+)
MCIRDRYMGNLTEDLVHFHQNFINFNDELREWFASVSQEKVFFSFPFHTLELLLKDSLVYVGHESKTVRVRGRSGKSDSHCLSVANMTPNRSHSISINKHKSTCLFNNSDEEPQVSPASKSHLLNGLNPEPDVPRTEELKKLYRRMVIAKQNEHNRSKSKTNRSSKATSRSMKENVRYFNNRDSEVYSHLRDRLAKQTKGGLV